MSCFCSSASSESLPDLENPKAPTIPQKRTKIVVGIYRFKANDSKDLSFSKGDRMKVLDDREEKWIFVEHLSTMRRGLVPANFVALESSLESYDWFFGNVSRKEAETLILADETQPNGTFLIRPSESRHGYSLSVKYLKQVKHNRIEVTDDGRFYIIKTQKFRTLPDLVSTYSKRSRSQKCVLSIPCKKPEPFISDLSSNYRDKWEIERSEITILQKLGSGNFGEVFHGKWKDRHDIAVKTLRPGSTSIEEFLKEAAIMKTFRHTNLVQLYGVCTIKEPLYIVQEFMANGSVQKYLSADRGKTVKFEDLIFIAFQIASGMEHLELINYVHRDLAARNVLLGPNNLAKICDFGLSRIINNKGYYRANGEELPYKWTAPEALQDSVFTIKSDVWSYGILLMELFTYGETPYKGQPFIVVLKSVLAGKRMPKPRNHQLPDEIYESVMLQCWHRNPEKRPTFKDLAKYFEQIDITYKICGDGKRKIVITHNASNSYEDHNVKPQKR